MVTSDPLPKRGRGRPKGSGAIDDAAALRSIAAHLVSRPNARLAAALRTVCDKADVSRGHRLRRKWRAFGPSLIAAEVERGRREQRSDVEIVSPMARDHAALIDALTGRIPTAGQLGFDRDLIASLSAVATRAHAATRGIDWANISAMAATVRRSGVAMDMFKPFEGSTRAMYAIAEFFKTSR